MGEWLTVREAATEAGVDDDTIRRWADGGRLAHRRTPGGHRRIPRSELLALMGEPSRRQRRHVNPLDAIEDWAAQLEEFFDWEPPEHLPAQALADVRVTIEGIDGRGGMIATLRGLADRLADAVDARDGRAAAPSPPPERSRVADDLAHLLAMPLPSRRDRES